MDKYDYEDVTINNLKRIKVIVEANWSSWQTGFDVKYFYNYENYFVDGTCQRNPHYLYFETCISIILLFQLFYYSGYFIISLYGELLKVTSS